jgi:hypothetical protein
MQLENIILTDVHQVQKDKSHMFLSYMWNMDLIYIQHIMKNRSH